MESYRFARLVDSLDSPAPPDTIDEPRTVSRWALVAVTVLIAVVTVPLLVVTNSFVATPQPAWIKAAVFLATSVVLLVLWAAVPVGILMERLETTSHGRWPEARAMAVPHLGTVTRCRERRDEGSLVGHRLTIIADGQTIKITTRIRNSKLTPFVGAPVRVWTSGKGSPVVVEIVGH